jgi:hypothetical protein
VKSFHAFQSPINGLNLNQIFCPTSLTICKACIKGKQHRATIFSGRKRQVYKPLEIENLNMFGFMTNIIFIDDSMSIGNASKWENYG